MRRPNLLDPSGFSMIEVLVAVAILVIGLLPISSAINHGLKNVSAGKHSIVGATLLERAAEEAKDTPFDDLSSENEPDFGSDRGDRGYSLERTVTDAQGMADVKRVQIEIRRGDRLLARGTFLIHRKGF